MKTLTKTPEVEVESFETLFYNMLVAEADYLYGLPQWMDITGEDKIKELTKIQEIQNCCQGQRKSAETIHAHAAAAKNTSTAAVEISQLHLLIEQK